MMQNNPRNKSVTNTQVFSSLFFLRKLLPKAKENAQKKGYAHTVFKHFVSTKEFEGAANRSYKLAMKLLKTPRT